MTEEEFRELYAGDVTTQEGIIIQVFRDGRLRVTDFPPGGVDLWLRVEDPRNLWNAALEVAEVNGWTGVRQWIATREGSGMYSLLAPANCTDEQAVRWEQAVTFWHYELFPDKEFSELTELERDEVLQAAYDCLVDEDVPFRA